MSSIIFGLSRFSNVDFRWLNFSFSQILELFSLYLYIRAFINLVYQYHIFDFFCQQFSVRLLIFVVGSLKVFVSRMSSSRMSIFIPHVSPRTSYVVRSTQSQFSQPSSTFPSAFPELFPE
ncbi:hypothetical protein BT96DRAFT_309843 [Gymnopus androsaceus JB14]|uniref:Uncharacterized protein n=1 Tax=Gymnopus androsaceus JB14 TaxID=1447944 RepID=A0A6A4H0Z1_9AGAR|nr:hypothetical protein BT96DRAFT_309843 [Gymnopus androsaceus JB14]